MRILLIKFYSKNHFAALTNFQFLLSPIIGNFYLNVSEVFACQRDHNFKKNVSKTNV